MDKQDFGKELVRARESKGYNSAQLAKELGVSANAVHKWEKKLSFPRVDKWQDIKRVTGIDPQDFSYDSTRFLMHDLLAPDIDPSTRRKLLHKYASTQEPELYKKIVEESPKSTVEDRLYDELFRFVLTRPIAHPVFKEPQKPVRARKPTLNNHLKDIAEWIGQQTEPEIYWAELKRHLMSIEPDFREYRKKERHHNK